MSALLPVFRSLKKAQTELALHHRRQKDAALGAAAKAIDRGRGAILAANAADVDRARKAGMKEALVDRLFLDPGRIDSIIEGIETVVRLDDPTGRVRSGWTTPQGLLIEQIAVPLGVAAIIYESRPNVTADAAALAYKAGCAILLRGSRSALESNRALCAAIRSGLEAGGGVAGAVVLCDPEALGAEAPDAAAPGSGAAPGGMNPGAAAYGDVDEILNARGFIDVVLPRGGRDLIRRVVENARVPVIETGEGNCHIYVDSSADTASAVKIIENAKLQKPGACNAVETLLVHRDALSALMLPLAAALAGRAELHCDGPSLSAITGTEKRLRTGETPPPHSGLVLKEAVEADWETEFLDYILAVKTVDSLNEAIEHINRYGTGHSEAILTEDLRAAEDFCRRVDAACVYVNASTRFTDGGAFGFGAELGISTQKFHARGPMGLEALTTIKYRVSGRGQIRE
ncbi:MAG: glutamate-5-semialdehyde dehydrogenase [Treponema sp.]|jgi:glutamate-5-semialdehyde dehydrogenase|nr:glutamate-5-semialdehyde dehydrogenase [Treponema sp.]